jgi:hypothetical protein
VRRGLQALHEGCRNELSIRFRWLRAPAVMPVARPHPRVYASWGTAGALARPALVTVRSRLGHALIEVAAP